MASRTRVPTKTIEDILAGAIDVIDRADRLLGQVDLIRYMGILCGSANPIDTQIIVGGVPVDPRARTWVLNQLTDSVQVTPILAAVWDVSDRWARQLGQIDLALYRGLACGAVNPLDIQIIVGGVVIDPRQIRALVAADIVTVNNLLNPHPVSLAAIPNPPNLDVALSTRASEATLAIIAAKDFATQTTLALIKAKTDNLDLVLSARTLTQHDNTTYYTTNSVSLAASGDLKAAEAGKKIRMHAIWGQGTANIEGNIQDGNGGTNILHFKFNDREGFLPPALYSPAFWGQNAANNTAIYITFTAAGQSYWTMIYSLV